MIDFKSFDEEQLMGCTYQDAQKILEALEEDCIIITNNIDIVVELESYLFVTNFLKDCAKDKMFPDFDYESPTASTELGVLLSRLVSITLNFESYKRIKELSIKIQNETTAALEMMDTLSDGVKNSESDVSSKINSIAQKIDSFNEKLDNYKVDLSVQQKNLTQQKESVKASLKRIKKETENSLQAQMRETERSTLTNVLTLLGVFSAVIVTIMTTVTTASSWINNANGSNAIIAFIIPASIIAITVILLLSLVYAFHNFNVNQKLDNSENNKNKDNTNTPLKWFLLTNGGIVLVLLGLIGWLSFLQNRAEKAIHIRQIIIASECPTEEDKENGLMYKIVYDNEVYTFSYDEAILHDGELHFCTEHRRLE